MSFLSGKSGQLARTGRFVGRHRCDAGGAAGGGIVQLARVFLEVEIAAESLAADATSEGFLLVVRVHVEGEVVDLVEGFVADDAFVGLFDAVRQFVVLVVAILVEALAAELADERLESGVESHVRVERRRPVEGLAARLALVRLVRRVDDLVTAQCRRLAKSFAAHFARSVFVSVYYSTNTTHTHAYTKSWAIFEGVVQKVKIRIYCDLVDLNIESGGGNIGRWIARNVTSPSPRDPQWK